MAENTGKSRERTTQQRVVERAARKESWLKQLLRSRRSSKGRPDPSDAPSRRK